tara:strand:+ start:44 stop:190 length:147 start_codon:yes stop_codon:yes gene_type:complete
VVEVVEQHHLLPLPLQIQVLPVDPVVEVVQVEVVTLVLFQEEQEIHHQ